MAKPTDIPFNSLRAFVSTARHGNFTRAATALGITQGAISHHVAKLEATAGKPLFSRHGSAVALTQEGQQLFEAVKDAMTTIELAVQQLSQQGRSHDRLVVRTSVPSFATVAVMPFLVTYASESGVQVDLVTSSAAPAPGDSFDVLISRNMDLPSAESWELIKEKVVCVGSPSLVAAQRDGMKPQWPMVACSTRPDLIPTWAIAKGIEADELQITGNYFYFLLAIEAAVSGVGFLIIPQLIIGDQLRNNKLVQVDELEIYSGESYMAYVNPRSNHVKTASDFCRWLKGTLRAL